VTAAAGVRATDYGGFYRERPVLITGGLGFIGSNLAWALVDLGARVLIGTCSTSPASKIASASTSPTYASTRR
jgi:UDP-glucose 4-epimerase